MAKKKVKKSSIMANKWGEDMLCGFNNRHCNVATAIGLSAEDEDRVDKMIETAMRNSKLRTISGKMWHIINSLDNLNELSYAMYMFGIAHKSMEDARSMMETMSKLGMEMPSKPIPIFAPMNCEKKEKKTKSKERNDMNYA